MRILLIILVGLWNVIPSFSQEKKELKEEMVMDAYINDSTTAPIFIRYQDKSLPDHFYANVKTPVCKEGLCYLLDIDLYWDLLGNFLKYKVPAQNPLTKFDHMEFTESDHGKLNQILVNKDSFLRFYSLENLIDTTEKRVSSVVDGISGATHKSIQSDVVSGAVYTSFVLWHIVNGRISELLPEYLESRFGNSLLPYFMESGNYHYQYYALQKITKDNSNRYLPQIIGLIAKGSNYVPYFAIELLSEETWKTPTYQKSVISLLDEVNFEMKNEILNRLKGIPMVEEVLDQFILKLDALEDGQVIKALAIVRENQNSLSGESRAIIQKLSSHNNKEIVKMTSLLVGDS